MNEQTHEKSRCLASLGGAWLPAEVRRENEDGTFNLEFDVKNMDFMPIWYGITADQISIGDDDLWPDVYSKITSSSLGLTQADLLNAVEAIGIPVSDDQLNRLWNRYCTDSHGVLAEGLGQEQAYQLILRIGLAAKRFCNGYRDDSECFKFYWNQTRMGGRDPRELPRIVTLDDAFHALGIREAIDPETAAKVEKYQRKNGIRFPSDLNRLLCCSGITNAIRSSHPNNPEFVLPLKTYAEFWPNPPIPDYPDAEFAFMILHMHGDPIWTAVFNDNCDEIRVFLKSGSKWKLVAPSIGMFFWDLAQTGLTWEECRVPKNKSNLEKSDIGVIPATA